ncbi:hypothetical protein SD71_01085 [Cohnella kolymensis]|uniref:DUF4007 domain-containing protein n=1 Tax=Cohnella kolymensis TaxID=1590652 RepID=A0ABR5A8H8_9BACL|nr:hypothetical protein SD71_01085 [Cohnella kolymensis]
MTKIGEIINTYDPYLDLPDSLSLLHYSLVNMDGSKERLIVWHGFFNIITRGAITKEEIVSETSVWAAKEGQLTSDKSLKRDVDCLCRLYLKDNSIKDPEDVTQSPLGKLGLLSTSSENSNIVMKNQLAYQTVGLTSLLYILLKYGEQHETDNVSVEEITLKADLWGKLF